MAALCDLGQTVTLHHSPDGWRKHTLLEQVLGSLGMSLVTGGPSRQLGNAAERL